MDSHKNYHVEIGIEIYMAEKDILYITNILQIYSLYLRLEQN